MARARGSMIGSLDNWTPKRAARFAERRIDLIRRSLQEIAYCYFDVDATIGSECDSIVDTLDGEAGLVALINDAEAEGRGQ